MSDRYSRLRQSYEDISGSVAVDITDTEPVVVPVNGSSNGLQQTIFVQRGTMTVQNSGAPGTTWTLADSEGAAVSEDYPVDADNPASIAFDFGATGRPLTEGAAFQLVCSAPGAGGLVTFEGYRKLTGVGAI